MTADTGIIIGVAVGAIVLIGIGVVIYSATSERASGHVTPATPVPARPWPSGP